MGTVTRYESMDEQVVLVTGATRGIGKQIAAQLTEFGATVYAGARNTVDITAESASSRTRRNGRRNDEPGNRSDRDGGRAVGCSRE